MDTNTEKRIKTLTPILNENQKRVYLALEAASIGRGEFKKEQRWQCRTSGTAIFGGEDMKKGYIEPTRAYGILVLCEGEDI